MGHEQRKFTPDSNRPQFAYNPEAQQIAVAEAQAKGLLVKHVEYQFSWQMKKEKEAELEWYVLGGLRLLSNDCDELVLRELMLHGGNVWKLDIVDGDYRPDVCFGRSERVTAVVFTERRKTLYISPGFDLEAYRQEQSPKEDNKS